MDLVSERRSPRRHLAVGAAMAALLLASLFALAPRADAAELIFWNNYSADPDNVAFANIDGTGGGILNLGGATLEDPEGMAYDSVTNRLFLPNDAGSPDGQITFINLNGSGGGVFTAPGAPIEEPEGVAIDPVTRMIYWLNTKGTDKISFARLDGTGGGILNTTGATLEGAYRIAIDPVNGRVYWGNTSAGGASISYANVNNSGGGNLDITGATAPADVSGLSVDPAGGRIYWLDNDNVKVSFASLTGGGGGDLNLTGVAFENPYGMALDPVLGRAYLANYGNSETKTGAFGVANLAGGGGGINIATAVVDGPQDPVILKSPTGAGAPAVTRSKKSRSALSCSTGTWGADFAGSFVYQAPNSYAYQWTRNGKAITGATASTFTAKSPGSYACAVTATNQAGNAAQTSAKAKVKAAKVKLTVKNRKATAKAGGVATFKVQALNQGDLKTKNARVCVKVPKKAKADLKAPKCKKLGKVKSRGKKAAKLKVEVGASAEGTYDVKIVVKGTSGKAIKAKIQVVG